MNYASFRVASSLLLVALGFSAAASRAQGPALDPVDQSGWERRTTSLAQEAVGMRDGTAPELFSGESADLGPQSILNVRPRRLIEFVADSQIFYTDNFFLTDGGEVGATSFVNTLQIALAPSPYPLGPGEFGPRLGIRQQWYNFGLIGNNGGAGFDFDDFDFYAQTAFVDGRYHFGDGWMAELGFDATRLVDDPGERYRDLSPRWALQKHFELGAAGQLFLGYEGAWHDSTDRAVVFPGFSLTDRVDHALFGVLTTTLAESLVAQAYYRFRYTSFSDSSRDDFLQSAGLGLHYFFIPQCSVRTFVAYDHRSTDDSPVPDYGKFNAGVGLNVTLSF